MTIDADVRRFVGALIHDVWIVWNASWNEVEQSSPIVVVTSVGQLELWAGYVTGFEITIDTVELSRLPSNYDGCELDLAWTNDELSVQRSARGQTITNVRALPNGAAGLAVRHAAGGFVGLNLGDEIGLLDVADAARWIGTP